MGKKAKYPQPELSEAAIQPLSGDRQRDKRPEVEFFSPIALLLAALGAYFQDTAFGLAACFLLISSWINQKPDTPFLSNSKISFFICIVMVVLTYFKKHEGY